MKRQVRTMLIAILAVVFVIAGIRLIFQHQEYQKGEETYDEAAQIAGMERPSTEPSPEPSAEPTPAVIPEPTQTAEPTPTPELTPKPSAPPASSSSVPVESGSSGAVQVDLAALRRVNPDVVGWISIPGTQLSYPLMQGADNDYYLNHTWKKAKSAVGSIYLDYRNHGDMSDFNSIIYGHRMSDGSMFNSLRHYKDLDYWKAHPAVYIVTDSGVHRYEVFAAYEADAVNGHTYRLGLEEADGQQAYINYCARRSAIETGVIPEPGDRIITLSTCVSLGATYDTRWVVQAVLKTNP